MSERVLLVEPERIPAQGCPHAPEEISPPYPFPSPPGLRRNGVPSACGDGRRIRRCVLAVAGPERPPLDAGGGPTACACPEQGTRPRPPERCAATARHGRGAEGLLPQGARHRD